jgi:hypothetical protein
MHAAANLSFSPPHQHHTPTSPTNNLITMSFCSGCIDLKEIPGSPSGKTEKIAGLDAYVAPGSKKGTIVRGGTGCTAAAVD